MARKAKQPLLWKQTFDNVLLRTAERGEFLRAVHRLVPAVQDDLRTLCREMVVACTPSEKARKQLGWRPRFGIEQGLRETIEWYAGQEDRKAIPQVSTL